MKKSTVMSGPALVVERPSGPLPARQKMEGRLDTAAHLVSDRRCASSALLVVYSGEGTLSPVGRVSFRSSHCSYLTPEGTSSGRCGEARLVMVTANGDEVHAGYSGQRLDGSRYLGMIRFVGGTGAYAEATGSLLAIATVDPKTSDVSVRGWGWMAL